MDLALGIDTGGTYTDAVLVDHATGQVLAGAKALTTRHDLPIGIEGAITGVFESKASVEAGLSPDDVVLVALSTTLATNTLAEGQGASVTLILIGYDQELMQQLFNQIIHSISISRIAQDKKSGTEYHQY